MSAAHLCTGSMGCLVTRSRDGIWVADPVLYEEELGIPDESSEEKHF